MADLHDSKPDLMRLWIPFTVLHVSGQAGIFIILVTIFLSSQVHFHPTIVNFWIAWFIYSVSYSLQLYHSNHEDILDGSSILCRVQAVLVDGASALAGTAALIAVAQVWYSLQRAPLTNTIFKLTQNEIRRRRIIMSFLIALPYLVFIAFGISAYIVNVGSKLKYTSDNGLYCSLHMDEFSRYSIPGFCVAVVMVVVIFEIAIMVKYIKIRRQASSAFPLAERTFPIALAIRVMIFSIVSLLVLCIGVFFMSNNLPSWPYMMQASLPLAAVITFGSQQDLLRAWCFWKPRTAPSTTPKHHVRQFSLDTASTYSSTTDSLGADSSQDMEKVSSIA
ncbi:hypothetical protein VKT23_005354 [Stygiomarasmius scandens]|uniref:Uncharacterized protein n=1 Tax=Marasmiellus scandens TaxID=2682957 RepID=A0ABR1JT67_9AGAR